jgi:hypothetical protein
MLFEEIEADFQILLGAYGLKRELFPNNNGATFENQKEAEKSTYTNTIIPEANEWVNALNNYYGTDKQSFEIQADFSHLPIFDDNLKDRGIALNQNIKALDIAFNSGAITLETYTSEVAKML